MQTKMEWKKVEDTNENEDSEFEGEVWKPEMVDEGIIGKYIEKEENVGRNEDSTLYHIKNDEDYWKVWGSKLLDGLFKDMKYGTMVKLVYKGKRKSQKGFFYKVYELYTAGGGEAQASSSSSDEPEQINMVENEVNDTVNEQVNGQKKDWFDKVKENLPQSKEDLKDKEKVACEWINRIRSDLLNEGVKKVTPKMIRDNVAVLVSEENMKEDDLGDLNEDAGRDIFKVLRNVDPV